MHDRRSCLGVAIVTGLAATLLLTGGVLGAEKGPPQEGPPKEAPAKAGPPRDHRPLMSPKPGFLPPGMPPHAGLPNVLKALQEAGKAMASSGIGKPEVDVAVDLLSGNSPKLLSELAAKLLSGNRAKLLFEMNPPLLSGNETELLSGNEVEILSGNRISILSNIKIEIHISGSGNQSHNQAPPPPGMQPPRGKQPPREPVKREPPKEPARRR